MLDFNRKLIEELRSNGGRIAAGPMAGRALLILTTRGARSGEPREAVLTYTPDGDRYAVAGSAGGSPRDPAWVRNLAANPVATAELDGRTLQVRATIVDEAERERLWTLHVAAHPEFAGYPEQTGRTIPMVTLEPTSQG